jgi:predicted glycoside hydrolase/deacetylase ChbG (UPF0249 family)
LLARTGGTTLAQRLGYPPDARLLLLHADDLGLLHSVNAAGITLFEAGVLRSGSVMVPSPWFPEFAAYLQTRPALDIGIHLTFICERPNFRWGPVLGAAKVPSLVDGGGYFPVSWEPDREVNLAELEAEIRAQVERAAALGVSATHLDAHAHTLQWRGRPVFEVLQKVARDYRLPVRVGRNWYTGYPYLAQSLGQDGIVLDRCITIPPGVEPEGWAGWYAETIHGLAPGVTEIFLHPGYDDGELRAFAGPGLSWGSTWRQRDFDAVQTRLVKDAIAAVGARPVLWRDIRRLLLDGTPTAGN